MTKSWRDVLPVHPAAEMFPMMSEAELRELGEDIKANGLKTAIVLWIDESKDKNDPARYSLLDGRNRLDAMELVGIEFELRWGKRRYSRRQPYWHLRLDCAAMDETLHVEAADPYDFVISANARRRHLTAEQKRDIIAALLKADPTKSDRAIAKTTKTDHKTVASVRARKERRGEIPHVKTRTDTKGRQQPASKQKAAKVEPEPEPEHKSEPVTAAAAGTNRSAVQPEDSESTNPIVEAWDNASPEQRRDFLLARMPQQQIGEVAHNDILPSAPAVADDGLVPDHQRAPKVRNIDGWQEVEPGFYEKVIDGKVERSAAFHPNLPEKDVADVLRGYEAQLMEPVHHRALDQWTAENGWRFLPTKEGDHIWRKVIDGKPYDTCIVAETADIARALALAEEQERTRRKAAATRAAKKRTNAAADSGIEAA